MFNRLTKVPEVTWKTVVLNPIIFTLITVPPEVNSTLGLIATGVILVGAGSLH